MGVGSLGYFEWRLLCSLLVLEVAFLTAALLLLMPPKIDEQGDEDGNE